MPILEHCVLSTLLQICKVPPHEGHDGAAAGIYEKQKGPWWGALPFQSVRRLVTWQIFRYG